MGSGRTLSESGCAPSFANCLVRCREYGKERMIDAQEEAEDKVRQQLKQLKIEYHENMIQTMKQLPLSWQSGQQKNPNIDITNYDGLYYENQKLHVQFKHLDPDMINWIRKNKRQLLEQIFSEVDVTVIDHSVYEDGIDIWFMLVRTSDFKSQVTMLKSSFIGSEERQYVMQSNEK
jgi:hypothetical protein